MSKNIRTEILNRYPVKLVFFKHFL